MYGEDFKLGHHDEQLISPRTRKRVLDHQEHLIPHEHPSKNKILSKSQIFFMDLSLATTSSDQEPDQDQETAEMATTTTCSNSNNHLNLDLVPIEKEHMFDKVVTPSDVGKLNRLVIPKQHAEKYFPLADSNQNGTLLNFQDRNGKMWRFRYSYWNSSQSYVMTKGWSRFVKEKKLDAGDMVSFHRGVGGEFERSKLFIDWRHRPDINLVQNHPTSSSRVNVLHRLATGNFTCNFINSFNNFPTAVHSGRLNSIYPPEYSVPVSRSLNFGIHNSYHHQHHQCNYRQEREINLGYGYGSIVGRCCYARSPLDQNNPVGSEPLVIDSVPVVPGRINPEVIAPSQVAGKRLRLFGVNMEYCGTDGHVPRGEMVASSSSSSTLQLSLSSDDYDQFAKKGKSSLSFGLDP